MKLKEASSFLPLHQIFNKFLVFPHQVLCLLKNLHWMGLCVLEVDTVSCSPYRPHNDAIIAHRLNSCLDNLSIIDLVRRKKLAVEELAFWILPLTNAHTLRARGHSHRMCPIFSSCCPHCWDIHCQVQCNNSTQQRLVFNLRNRASTTASFGSNDIVVFISNIGGLNSVVQLNILECLLAVTLRRERQLELVRISSSFPGIHFVILGLVN